MPARRSSQWKLPLAFIFCASPAGLGCVEPLQNPDLTPDPGAGDPGDLPDEPAWSDEVCGDGNDNDQDGRAEEDCPCTPQQSLGCYLGPQGTRGVGACVEGTQVCRGDEATEFGSFGECVGAVGPSPEVCDGVDNDCNGAVDDNDMCNSNPPEAICPGDLVAQALVAMPLAGGCTDDSGACTSFEWAVVSAPGGSVALPLPPNAAETTFTPDLAGEYTIRLTVRDAQGNFDSCDVLITVPTSEGLRVEIYWNDPDRSCADDDWEGGFPECDDSDVDLHMINTAAATWFSDADCYFSNCKRDFHSVSWNAAGEADDPFLDIDDVEGHGPENINVDQPAAGETYTIGVHYWSPDSWEGGAEILVKIYCGGDLPVDEFGPVALPEQDDFWRVADVTFDAGGCHVDAIDRNGQELTDQTAVRAGR
ncbi:MAG: hypothetical protein HYY06_18780 [Deltaproteobacteria bacterium]|nr:hypothetical protein [Deltaproteobacteria bacterium]